MTEPTLDDRLDAFAALSAGERARVVAEVEASRPDLADALATAQALAAHVDAAAADRSDLAARVADARLGHGPEPLAEPADAGALADLHATLDRFEAEGESPLAQFERLTGHVLAEPDAAPEAAQDFASAPSGDGAPVDGRALALALDRAAAPPPRARLWRRVAAAGLVLVVGYSLAFATSAALVPERAQMAEIGDVEATFRPVRSDASDAYAEALDVLTGARRSTLGLFPRYDDDALDRAADLFGAVASDDPQGAFGQEAALAIGRIRVLQGRDAEARVALESVEARRSYRAPEAARLLDYLDAQARAQ